MKQYIRIVKQVESRIELSRPLTEDEIDMLSEDLYGGLEELDDMTIGEEYETDVDETEYMYLEFDDSKLTKTYDLM